MGQLLVLFAGAIGNDLPRVGNEKAGDSLQESHKTCYSGSFPRFEHQQDNGPFKDSPQPSLLASLERGQRLRPNGTVRWLIDATQAFCGSGFRGAVLNSVVRFPRRMLGFQSLGQ